MKRVGVMGIVNVTPDSFSDGGMFFSPAEAVRRAVNLVKEGADVIDIGGESTRPGSTPIDWREEWERIEPVIRGLDASAISISVDTYHPETAERALALGVRMINCVYTEPVADMLALAVRADAELVIPSAYKGAIGDMSRIYLDPMIGFGTTREQDMELIASIPALAGRGRVLVGVSRKRIIKRLTGEKVTGKNLAGSIALALWCALKGADMLRVHDVGETVQALKVIGALT